MVRTLRNLTFILVTGLNLTYEWQNIGLLEYIFGLLLKIIKIDYCKYNLVTVAYGVQMLKFIVYVSIYVTLGKI